MQCNRMVIRSGYACSTAAPTRVRFFKGCLDELSWVLSELLSRHQTWYRSRADIRGRPPVARLRPSGPLSPR